MLEAKDLRDQTIEELTASIEELRKKKFELANEGKTSTKSGSDELVKSKRDIARILTVMHEKKIKG